MHKLNLAPCVPPELFEYMDSVSDKVNIAFKVGHDLIGTFRDIRTAEYNTQIVTLFSSVQVADNLILAAIYLPEWNHDRSHFAVCTIVDNQVTSVKAPRKDHHLLELDLEEANLNVVAAFFWDYPVAQRGKMSTPIPCVQWFTPCDIEATTPIEYGREPLPEPIIPEGHEDKVNKPPRKTKK